ncbi:MAG: hypothetical protein JWL75_677 [Parcubacteria group bacterium]|nr:hypothetical protein [Parcubacteria group bacterium]
MEGFNNDKPKVRVDSMGTPLRERTEAEEKKLKGEINEVMHLDAYRSLTPRTGGPTLDELDKIPPGVNAEANWGKYDEAA